MTSRQISQAYSKWNRPSRDALQMGVCAKYGLGQHISIKESESENFATHFNQNHQNDKKNY